MIRRTWIARLLVVSAATGVLVAAPAPSAQAGLLPVSVTVQPESGNFRWTYSVVLPTNMQLKAGDYFTIYDFAGLQAGSASVTSTGPSASYSQYWTATTSNTGVTPAGLNPTDNPGTPNVTFTYEGPTISAGQLTLGNFSLVSTFGTETTGAFAALNQQALSGAADANLTSTEVPLGSGSPPATGTPEPATLVLAGLGMPLIGLGRFLRRKGQATA